MDKRLLEILCCPVSKVPVRLLKRSELAGLNEAIDAGEVLFVDGSTVPERLTDGLITDDKKVIYPIEEDIPVMLPDKGIGTTQFDPSLFR